LLVLVVEHAGRHFAKYLRGTHHLAPYFLRGKENERLGSGKAVFVMGDQGANGSFRNSFPEMAEGGV
jgi:hypothetical protein